MAWHVALVLMVLRPQVPVNQPIYCWENLLLIEVPDDADPWEVAEQAATERSITTEFEANRVYSVPARWELAGIRKVVEVRHDSVDGQLVSGDELTYNTLRLDDESEIQKFVAGEECSVRYDDDTHPNERR